MMRLSYITSFRFKFYALPNTVKFGVILLWATFSFGIMYDTFRFNPEQTWIGVVFCLFFGWLLSAVAFLLENDASMLMSYSDNSRQDSDAKLGRLALRILLLIGNAAVLWMVLKQLGII